MADLLYEQLYYDSYLAGAENGYRLAGVEPPPLTEDAEQSLRKQARRQAAQLESMVLASPEARERIASYVSEWLGQEGPLSLADLRAALSPEFGAARSLVIARTEVRASFEAANTAAIRAAGFDWMEWSAALDACDLCASLDGKVMSVDDYEEMSADTHPNCSCVGLPSDAPEGTEYAVESPFEETDLEREAPDVE